MIGSAILNNFFLLQAGQRNACQPVGSSNTPQISNSHSHYWSSSPILGLTRQNRTRWHLPNMGEGENSSGTVRLFSYSRYCYVLRHDLCNKFLCRSLSPSTFNIEGYSKASQNYCFQGMLAERLVRMLIA